MAPSSSAAGGHAQTPVSVTIWQGKQTNGAALFQVFGQPFYGVIKTTGEIEHGDVRDENMFPEEEVEHRLKQGRHIASPLLI